MRDLYFSLKSLRSCCREEKKFDSPQPRLSHPVVVSLPLKGVLQPKAGNFNPLNHLLKKKIYIHFKTRWKQSFCAASAVNQETRLLVDGCNFSNRAGRSGTSVTSSSRAFFNLRHFVVHIACLEPNTHTRDSYCGGIRVAKCCISNVAAGEELKKQQRQEVIRLNELQGGPETSLRSGGHKRGVNSA